MLTLANLNCLVTGGAGFIGSHIVDHLLANGAKVAVFDNFLTGFRGNIAHHQGNPDFQLIEGDTRDLDRLVSSMKGCQAVFHLQANADVRGGMIHTRIDLEQNTIATWNVLEAMRQTEAKHLVFASSATVYGEPATFPTPEDTPLIQTSLYGASKLAGEAMIHAYAEYYGIRTLIFRFVSWTGPRYSHGVVFDFVKKLQANPRALEILGDGKQQKSYLDVRDGISGIFTAFAQSTDLKSVYNLGHDKFMNVLDLARIIIDEMNLADVALNLTGGQRGWVGDSPIVHLDTARIKSLGWTPQIPIADSIRATARHLLTHPELLESR